MQYTIRNIPKQVDAKLRRKAVREKKSLNEVVVETLAEATGLGMTLPRVRDLSAVAGKGKGLLGPEFEAAMRVFDSLPQITRV